MASCAKWQFLTSGMKFHLSGSPTEIYMSHHLNLGLKKHQAGRHIYVRFFPKIVTIVYIEWMNESLFNNIVIVLLSTTCYGKDNTTRYNFMIVFVYLCKAPIDLGTIQILLLL